jgi:hypothetical protein
VNDVAATSAPFHFVAHWPQGSAKDGMAVLEFWRREKALGDEVQAQERLREIVLHATDASGEVAAVCTAVPITLPRLAQPMYYYRCFVGQRWRSTRLVFTLLNRAFATLERYARENRYPCIGVLLELENERFGKSLRAPMWPGIGFVYAGKSGRGLELRVRYFRGARLKPSSKQ